MFIGQLFALADIKNCLEIFSFFNNKYILCTNAQQYKCFFFLFCWSVWLNDTFYFLPLNFLYFLERLFFIIKFSLQNFLVVLSKLSSHFCKFNLYVCQLLVFLMTIRSEEHATTIDNTVSHRKPNIVCDL